MKAHGKRKLIILICAGLLILLIAIVLRGNKKETKGGENKMNVETFQSYYQFSCNVYIVSSDKGNILIDPGHYDEEIKDYIDQIGGLDAILLTHGHWDHTYGLDRLKRDFPDVPVYMPEDGYDFLQDPYLNGSSMNGFNVYVQADVNTIPDGDLKIGNYDIDVLNMPGHCRGCYMYYFKDENVLFTGDAILKDLSVPIRATGSAEDQTESMKKFIRLGYDTNTPVYPGHGESTTYGYLLENNPDVMEARR